MQSLKLQVSDLIPNSLSDAKLEDLLDASAKVVLDSLPPMLLSPHSSTANTSSSVLAIKNKRIIKVVQNNYSASLKDASLEHWLTDVNSIHYADSTSPMYVIKQSGDLKCYPTGTEAAVDYIGYPSIDASDISIAGLPDTAFYAVVLGTAIKVAQVLLGELIHTDEDVELASAMQLESANLQALYLAEMQRLTG